jgi:hypothetical protein
MVKCKTPNEVSIMFGGNLDFLEKKRSYRYFNFKKICLV